MEKIIVSDMNCKHCVISISSALADNNIEFEINLENKEVKVENDDLNKACVAIKNAGFTVCE